MTCITHDIDRDNMRCRRCGKPLRQIMAEQGAYVPVDVEQTDMPPIEAPQTTEPPAAGFRYGFFRCAVDHRFYVRSIDLDGGCVTFCSYQNAALAESVLMTAMEIAQTGARITKLTGIPVEFEERGRFGDIPPI